MGTKCKINMLWYYLNINVLLRWPFSDIRECQHFIIHGCLLAATVNCAVWMNYHEVTACYLLFWVGAGVFWSCCIFLWRSRLTNWSKAKGSIPDHDPLAANIVSVSSSSESLKRKKKNSNYFVRFVCPSHDFLQHNAGSLEQPLGFCLHLVYPSGQAPAAFACSRVRPSNWTRHGPRSHSAGISIGRHPPIHPPSPSALISSPLLPLQLKGLQLRPWMGIASHQAGRYQNVNDSRVEAGEARCAGIEHPMSRASGAPNQIDPARRLRRFPGGHWLTI